jgi:hypothetical protein
MLLTKNEARISLIALLLISACGFVDNSLGVATAQTAFDFSISLNGYSISLAPNHSGYVEVTVSLVSGTPQNVTLTSTVSPQDGELSTSLAESWGYPSFVTTLIVSALNAQPGKQYQVTVGGTSQGLTRRAPALTVTISCAQGTCSPPSPTLTTAIVGEGSVNPSCPSGCPEAVGHVLNVTAAPAPSWMFSGWNVTGASCLNGPNANPCVFTMPNDTVSITANFLQYQILYTSTSTITTSTTSATAIGETTTTTVYSTSNTAVTQTQSSSFTQFSTLTTNQTTVTMAVQNPLLELTIAGIILFSVLAIGVNLTRRSRHQPVVCARCGFNNPSGRKYCVNCGETLKGS